MIIKKPLVLICCFVLVNSLHLQSQSTVDMLERYFSTAFRNKIFNGNVLIAERGKIIYKKSFGYADVSAKKLNSGTSTFHIDL